ncbi:hypothetical protein [Nocardia abscessus]|nr:hypothetical protein [Nocardia abscessus]
MTPLNPRAPAPPAWGPAALTLWVRDRIEEILSRMDSHMETEE